MFACRALLTAPVRSLLTSCFSTNACAVFLMPLSCALVHMHNACEYTTLIYAYSPLSFLLCTYPAVFTESDALIVICLPLWSIFMFFSFCNFAAVFRKKNPGLKIIVSTKCILKSIIMRGTWFKLLLFFFHIYPFFKLWSLNRPLNVVENSVLQSLSDCFGYTNIQTLILLNKKYPE